MRDYYYILGLTSSATDAEIKTAYRKLSLKFHPDKNSGDKYFEERFKDIQVAYETLSTKRNEYDYKLNLYNSSKTNREYLKNHEEELKRKYEQEFRKREEEINKAFTLKENALKEEIRQNKKTSNQINNPLVILILTGVLIGVVFILIQINNQNKVALENHNLIKNQVTMDSLDTANKLNIINSKVIDDSNIRMVDPIKLYKQLKKYEDVDGNVQDLIPKYKTLKEFLTALGNRGYRQKLHQYLSANELLPDGAESYVQFEKDIMGGIVSKPQTAEEPKEVEKNNTNYRIETEILNVIKKYYRKEFETNTRLEETMNDSINELVYYSIPNENDPDDHYLIHIIIPLTNNMNLFGSVPILKGDINYDNIDDLVISVHTEIGNHASQNIFTFVKSMNKYKLIDVSYDHSICGCYGNFRATKIENNLIIGESRCYADDDPRCCPSLEYETKVAFNGNKLKFLSQR